MYMYVCKQIEIMIPPPKLVAIYCNTAEQQTKKYIHSTHLVELILICYNCLL